MSIQSWIDEFYPVTAEECLPDDALEHSIKKWEGLQPDALERHGLLLDCTTAPVLINKGHEDYATRPPLGCWGEKLCPVRAVRR